MKLFDAVLLPQTATPCRIVEFIFKDNGVRFNNNNKKSLFLQKRANVVVNLYQLYCSLIIERWL